MMKRKLKHITNASMLAISLLPLLAVAGPDWSVIQDARRMSSLHNKAILEKQAMPVDHGPRALSTTWLNEEHAQEKQDKKMIAQPDKHSFDATAYSSI